MILLTGATGTVGRALLRRLTAGPEPVRCLVRDPKRLGAERVRVQLALGDLADPASFRNAMRGVDTVVHLAASIRDQPRGSIEELNAMATLRLVRAAERAGARRFVFVSAMGASLQSPTRFFRAKALARRAVERSRTCDTVVFSPSIVYTPGDPWLTLLERFALLPAMPISGSGRRCSSRSGPRTWPTAWSPRSERPAASDTPSSTWPGPVAVLRRHRADRAAPHGPAPPAGARAAAGGARARCGVLERLTGPAAFATWEEAELMEEPMTTSRGTADAEALGVTPLRMSAVLGTA